MSFLLDDKHVKVHVPAATWEEAIQAAGQVLADAGSITDQYTANMIQAVKELCPYICLLYTSSIRGNSKITSLHLLIQHRKSLPISIGQKYNTVTARAAGLKQFIDIGIINIFFLS